MSEQQVDVKDYRPMATTEPDQHLSAISRSGKVVEALPDDPDELLSTLKQMARAAGGVDDASFYVDGFRFFFFNDTATTEIYTLSLHDALPIYNCAHCLIASVR